MPLPLLRAYVRGMPKLEAQDALREMSIAAVGSGVVKKQDAQRIVASWRRVAGGTGVDPRPHLTHATLQAWGIQPELMRVAPTSAEEGDA